jgi:drug/metabolite transporter (DMT)-like permease
VGAGVLVFAALSWSIGSLYSRRAALPESPFLGTAMEMLMGGVWLVGAGLINGEWARLDLGGVSARSGLALGYLIVFGSLVAFSAYIWLLKATSPARASTYAFVNPVVAVFLGWALAGERLTPQMLLAAGIIVAAVVIITTSRAQAERTTVAVAPPGGSSGWDAIHPHSPGIRESMSGADHK